MRVKLKIAERLSILPTHVSTGAPNEQSRRRIEPLLLILIACAVMMFLARLLGPSALQRHDQPRTASYTADIVANGRWLLPRDMLGNTATKPPLVNWLAAPLLMLGFWTEWAVKAPMATASIATLILTVSIARRLLRAEPNAREGALLAGMAWLVNPANINMIYHCRPDPVLITFLTCAWILATRIVCDENPPRLATVVGFWICVGLAALTKGPAALLPIIYLPLAARLIGGRWELANRSRWRWGLPLALGLFFAWAIPCALKYPEPFFKVLVGRELIAQALGLGHQFGSTRAAVTSEGPIAALKLIYQNPLWFIDRFAPWSAGAISALIVIGWRRWFRHPLAPAILWMLLVLGFFALSAHKTSDYIQPAYPAAAVLAGWFCITCLKRYRVQPSYVAIGGLLFAMYLSIDAVFFSIAAQTRTGENVKDFAREVDRIVDREPLAFANTGFNTLGLFLRRHQPSRTPTVAEIAAAKWIIMPPVSDVQPVLLSKPIAIDPKRPSASLALYRVAEVREQIPVSGL